MSPIMNKASLGEGVQIRDIFNSVFLKFNEAAQKGKLDDQMQTLIKKDMEAIVSYQLKMKECWNSFRSPMEVKSILGLVPDYKHIDTILENQSYDNPAINFAFYDNDMLHLNNLSTVMLILLEKHLIEIKFLIEQFAAY